MRIGLVSHTSKSTYHLSDLIYEVEKKINEELVKLDLFNVLDTFVIGINLSEFEPSDKLITHFKNYKAEKQFEFTLNLKVEKYINNDLTQFKFNFFEDFKIALAEVFEKKIKNKDLGVVIISLAEKAIKGKSTQNIDALVSKVSHSNSANESNTIEYTELEESLFWEIIEQSFVSNLSFEKSINLLEKILCKNDDSVIIGFQITLRKLIDKLGSEFVIDKAKKVNDYITDDTFLYLRSYIITKGKTLFKQLEFEVEDIPTNIFKFNEGEKLLYAADDAINLKYKNDYTSDLPSYVANKIYGPLL
ncbi:MAG: DUF4240 domain-containing protein [Bacteroidota bacterium]|nr:DUF4240 domain-containing protein [Bacteroidota bacterium]MDP3147212.1 DUF4240 domain-containing protein [Bacteroidota bacterium]